MKAIVEQANEQSWQSVNNYKVFTVNSTTFNYQMYAYIYSTNCFVSIQMEENHMAFSPRNCLRWHHKHRHGLRTQTTRNQLPGPLMTITPELTSNMVLDATALTHKIPTKQVSTFDVSARCDTHLNTQLFSQQTTFHHKIQTHSHYKSQPWCRHLAH